MPISARPALSSAIPPIAQEALIGLRQPQKTIPAKLFYDAVGCALFEQITRLPEYYVTRTELALLETRAAEIAAALPSGAALVEYGASDEAKAAYLLRVMMRPAAYVPIDVAESALDEVTARMHDSHPGLLVTPVHADFMAPLRLPAAVLTLPVAGFFPGSTIGNLDPASAVRFLQQARTTLGAGAVFVVGVDLRKDPAVLIPAYDDAAGVTAAFNRNILAHLNRATGSDFDLGQFRHRAVWNAAEGRIEMHLVSLSAQTARLAGETVAFAEGETIHTENSYKHTVAGFRALAARGGWRHRNVWMDPDKLFSIHLLDAGV